MDCSSWSSNTLLSRVTLKQAASLLEVENQAFGHFCNHSRSPWQFCKSRCVKPGSFPVLLIILQPRKKKPQIKSTKPKTLLVQFGLCTILFQSCCTGIISESGQGDYPTNNNISWCGQILQNYTTFSGTSATVCDMRIDSPVLCWDTGSARVCILAYIHNCL